MGWSATVRAADVLLYLFLFLNKALGHQNWRKITTAKSLSVQNPQPVLFSFQAIVLSCDVVAADGGNV